MRIRLARKVLKNHGPQRLLYAARRRLGRFTYRFTVIPGFSVVSLPANPVFVQNLRGVSELSRDLYEQIPFEKLFVPALTFPAHTLRFDGITKER